MNQKTQDTKEKILATAQNLFASHGYDGTSVRDIANAADVNLAAVNYHFRNKQTLYWEIFVRAYTWLESTIEELGKNAENTEDLVWKVYQHLMQKSDYLSAVHRTILTSNVPGPEGDHKVYTENIKIGPPGAMTIARSIVKEIGDPDPAGVLWAVSSIFSSVFHWALMFNASYFQRMKQTMNITEESMKCHITLHTRALMEYLKAHKGDFPQIEDLACTNMRAALDVNKLLT